MDYESICDMFLRDQEWAGSLRAVVELTMRYNDGHPPDREASGRRESLRDAARHMERALKSFRKLGDIAGAEAMNSRRDQDRAFNLVTMPPEFDEALSSTPHVQNEVYRASMPQLLAEREQLIFMMEKAVAGLLALSEAEVVRRRRPPLPDPIRYGVEALAGLWLKARGEWPTNSFKRGSFGEFVLAVFEPDGKQVPQTGEFQPREDGKEKEKERVARNLRTAVRQVLEDRSLMRRLRPPVEPITTVGASVESF